MFASVLSVFLLPLCSAFCPCVSASALLCLSSCLVFPFLLWLCVFLFPFGICAKRKGAPCWCVLSCPVVGCLIWSLLCTPRTRLGSIRQYRNKVLEIDNLIGCSKLFCARLCFCLCNSKSVLFLFSYLFLLVGSCFLSPFRYSLIRLPEWFRYIRNNPYLPHYKPVHNYNKIYFRHHGSTQKKNL